ncbi:MAG: glycosyltransferase family 4 protein [Acidobacteriota bacterium]|nr:glycosyltransferase family 4 protein [Acidobacteriota bacterium]
MSDSGQPLRIAYLAAGAGGMICGSCIHDNALVRELQHRGHNALLLPIYTPLRTDEENVSYGRVFYGAVNIYLEQKLPVWSRAPAAIRRLLDNPGLLSRVTRSASATDAHQLGELALSMVRGEEGRQLAELQGLTKWLAGEFRPDVVHLTNSMLVGMAHRLREALPEALIVCGLQGEDIFLEDLDEPHKSLVVEEMRKRVREVDVLVAPNDYYAATMADLLELPLAGIDVARLGIELEGHGGREAEPPESPLVIGYLARMCPEKGFHLAAEAFKALSDRLGVGRVRFRAAGYLGGRDRKYFEEQRRRIADWGLEAHFDWLGEVSREEKIELLCSLHALVLPTVYREAKGLPALEAMANGVPVLLPDHGSFPEMLERTGGGVLVPAGDPAALADAVEQLAQDAERRSHLGRSGMDGVRRHYSAELMAADTLASYRRGLARRRSGDLGPAVASAGHG